MESTYKFEENPVWRLKLRLQYSGWLQYAPNVVLVTLLYSLAWILRTVHNGSHSMHTLLECMGSIAIFVLVFDIVTVKLKLRPKECRPPRLAANTTSYNTMRIRQSCRSFQSRRLTKEDYSELVQHVQEQSVPSALIGRKPIRFEYVSAPLTVWPVVNAQEFLVAVAPKEYDRTAIIDIGRSLQKIVLEATRMGIGTCWIGPGANHNSIKQHLGKRFDDNVDSIICVCAVGYKSWFQPTFLRAMNYFVSASRLPLTELFFADPSMKRPLDCIAEPYSCYGYCYEGCRWAPSSFNAQPTRCVAVTKAHSTSRAGNGIEEEVERFDFYATTRSRYYAILALGIWLAHWELGCNELGKHGHFQIVSKKGEATSENPRYCMSWIPAKIF